jgi:hypothetical protein
MTNYYSLLWYALVAVVLISLSVLFGYLRLPQPPSELIAIEVNRAVTLQWKASSQSDIKLYVIYISLNPKGPYSRYALVPHPTTTYTITGLFEGATYYFRVSAVTTRNIESPPTKPIAVTIGEAPEMEPQLWAIPGDSYVKLFWEPQLGATYNVYISLSPDDSYSLIAKDVTGGSYIIEGLSNGIVYYFRVTVLDASRYQEQDIGSRVAAMPGDLLSFADNDTYYLIQYPVGRKLVQYRFNKKTIQGQDGLYEQFISDIRFDGIPITTHPYPGGLRGLILLYLEHLGRGSNPNPPHFAGTATELSPHRIVLRYVNIENTDIVEAHAAEIDFVVEAGRPYLKILQKITPTTPVSEFQTSWNVFIAFGGKYNSQNRIVIPYDERSYYVINGQALGIRYNPRVETWSLRMGAEGTPYSHITSGFFFANPQDAWLIDWPMARDYCNNPFKGDLQDTPPYGLDKIKGQVYMNYQEDEGGSCIPGGLGYSWQNAETAPRLASPTQPYVSALYYWVGEDLWAGEYGLNHNSTYQFNIKKWHDALKHDKQQHPSSVPEGR